MMRLETKSLIVLVHMIELFLCSQAQFPHMLKGRQCYLPDKIKLKMGQNQVTSLALYIKFRGLVLSIRK